MTSERQPDQLIDESKEPPTVLHIGSDRVLVWRDRLVIESPIDMEFWEVRTYRHTLIRFRGREWRIVRTGTGSRKTARYELEPWTPRPTELIGPTCDYGPAFVKQRARDYAESRRRTAVGMFLMLLLPLVGMLGSETKRLIEERYAIGAIAATRASLYFEVVLVLASATLLLIGVFVVGLQNPTPWPLSPLAVGALVLPPDLLIRYDRLIRDEQYPPGFYQWVWRRPR